MIWTTEKLNTAGRPTTCVQTAGDAENGEVGKQPDEINDAQRAE